MNKLNYHPYPKLPDSLAAKIQKHRGTYADFKTVFFVEEVEKGTFLAIVGDGENGAYEWFFVGENSMECSDAGFGETSTALLAALKKWHFE